MGHPSCDLSANPIGFIFKAYPDSSPFLTSPLQPSPSIAWTGAVVSSLVSVDSQRDPDKTVVKQTNKQTKNSCQIMCPLSWPPLEVPCVTVSQFCPQWPGVSHSLGPLPSLTSPSLGSLLTCRAISLIGACQAWQHRVSACIPLCPEGSPPDICVACPSWP